MVIETTTYNTKLFFGILQWYFIEMPIAIIKNTGKYLHSFAYVFSFLFLLKTLISPWKNQLYVYPSKGLDFQKILEVFVSNSVSRLVGLTMRLCVLGTGVLVELLTIIVGLSTWLIWLGAPIVFILSIIGSI